MAENKFNPNDPRDIDVVMRRFGGEDPTRIPNPDPNFAYRFLREDPKAIKKGAWKGWELIKDSEEAKRLGMRSIHGETNVDGCVRIQPDGILAKMPRKLYEEIEKKKREENRKRMARAEHVAEEKAKELGLPYEGGNAPLNQKERK